METLLFWLPDSFMVIGIVAIAFGTMLGTIPVRRAFRLIGLAVLLLVSSPFLDALIDYLWRILPIWVIALVIFVLSVATLRFLSELLLGKQSSNEMIGNLAASIVRGSFLALFRLLMLPFKVLLAKHRENALR